MSAQIPDHILRKIQKCLALSKSDNAREAATAIRQARALMDKYGVTEEQVEISSIIKETAGKIASAAGWFSDIALILNRVFSVYCIARGNELLIVGSPAKIKIARYMYELIVRQIMRDRRAYLSNLPCKQMTRTRKTALADVFCEAWISIVHERVKDLYAPKDEALEAYKKEHFSNIGEKEVVDRFDSVKEDPLLDRAAQEGFEKGEQASIFMAVTDQPRNAQIRG